MARWAWDNQEAAIAAAHDKLDWIISFLKGKVMASFADIQNAVTAETTVEQSVLTLLNGIAAQLATALAAGGTPAQIQGVVDALNANIAAMQAAVTANTPSAPSPAPAPATP